MPTASGTGKATFSRRCSESDTDDELDQDVDVEDDEDEEDDHDDDGDDGDSRTGSNCDDEASTFTSASAKTRIICASLFVAPSCTVMPLFYPFLAQHCCIASFPRDMEIPSAPFDRRICLAF